MSKTTSRQGSNAGSTNVAPVVAGGAPVISGGAGAPPASMQGQAVAARTVTLQLGAHAPTGRGNNRYSQRGWYLSREGDLANVTNEAENPALGILSLTITAPTPNQYATGIICKVAMESLTGWDYNMSIWESKKNPGDITLMIGGARENTNPSRPREDGSKQYFRDRRLNDATQAQILSFVMQHLQPAQPQA